MTQPGETLELNRKRNGEINHYQIIENIFLKLQFFVESYAGKDDLSAGFIYATYTKIEKKLPEFGLKDCLTLPSLSWELFNDKDRKSVCFLLHSEEYESIYERKLIR